MLECSWKRTLASCAGDRSSNFDTICNCILYQNLKENDGQGRLQSQTTPNQRPTGYTYTADGKVATLTRPDGSVISHSYYPQSGQLWKQTDAMGTLEHKYDIAGNLVSSSDGSHTLRYAYDLQSRLTRFTDKNGDQTVYAYYPNSLLKSVQYHAQSAADTVTVSYAYHPDRSLKSVTDWKGG